MIKSLWKEPEKAQQTNLTLDAQAYETLCKMAVRRERGEFVSWLILEEQKRRRKAERRKKKREQV